MGKSLLNRAPRGEANNTLSFHKWSAELKYIQDEGTSEFHPFPRLPIELRLKIWELATVHRHRVVELMPVTSYVHERGKETKELKFRGVAKFLGAALWSRSTPSSNQMYMDMIPLKPQGFKHWQTHSTTPTAIIHLSMTSREAREVVERICTAIRHLHLIRRQTFTHREFNHVFKYEPGMCCRQRYNPANITVFLRAWKPKPVADIPLHLPYEAKQATSLALEYVPSKEDVTVYLAKVLRWFRKLKYLVILARLDDRIGQSYHPGLHSWSAETANLYRPLEVTKWFSAIEQDAINLIKQKEPGWKMPLVKGVVKKDGNFGKLAYEDIFPEPNTNNWEPFYRLEQDGKWVEVHDHRGPEEFN